MFVVLRGNDQAVCLLAALDKQTEAVWEDAECLESDSMFICRMLLHTRDILQKQAESQIICGKMLQFSAVLFYRSAVKFVQHHRTKCKRQVKDNQREMQADNKPKGHVGDRMWKTKRLMENKWKGHAGNDECFHHCFLFIYSYSQLDAGVNKSHLRVSCRMCTPVCIEIK